MEDLHKLFCFIYDLDSLITRRDSCLKDCRGLIQETEILKNGQISSFYGEDFEPIMVQNESNILQLQHFVRAIDDRITKITGLDFKQASFLVARLKQFYNDCLKEISQGGSKDVLDPLFELIPKEYETN